MLKWRGWGGGGLFVRLITSAHTYYKNSVTVSYNEIRDRNYLLSCDCVKLQFVEVCFNIPQRKDSRNMEGTTCCFASVVCVHWVLKGLERKRQEKEFFKTWRPDPYVCRRALGSVTEQRSMWIGQFWLFFTVLLRFFRGFTYFLYNLYKKINSYSFCKFKSRVLFILPVI